MGYFFAYHFFPTRNKILTLKKPNEVLVKADRESQFQCPNEKKVFFPLDSIKIQTMKIGKKNGLLIFLYSLIQSRTKTLHGQARRLRIVVYMIISTFLHTSPFSTTSARSRPPKPIKWRRNSTEQCAIQEGCVHSTVDSNDIICLLPPIFCFVLFCFFVVVGFISFGAWNTPFSIAV